MTGSSFHGQSRLHGNSQSPVYRVGMTLKKKQIPSEVTIIGAGVIGVCCALSLQERGYVVRIIDRNEPGEGASFGNAGVISPWSCVPQCLPGLWRKVPGWLLKKEGPISVKLREVPGLLPWLWKFFANSNESKVNDIADMMNRLMFGNIPAYQHYLKNTGREHLLVDSNYVNVFRGALKPNLDDFAWSLRRERNAPVRIVQRQELLEMEPALADDCHSAIIIESQARAAHPGELCKALAEKVFADGGEFARADIKSLEVTSDGTFKLQSRTHSYHCERLVLAAGVWSTQLLGSLGIRMPLISERGYHVEFSEPNVTLNNSIMDVAGKFVVSSMLGRVRAAGTTELSGVDLPPDYARARLLERHTKNLFPHLNTSKSNYWMGARPSFPDSLPAIGRLPGFDNLFAAFGHSHYGMGMAPATGKIIANFVSGAPNNADLDMVRPDRSF